MTETTRTVRAADHLVEQLIQQGVSHAYGVPGESYLPVLDALYDRADDIQFITCRQEGGAAMAADAHARLTKRPGVCFVTRGPGATNASAGVHIAYQDSTPLILFIGQVARDMIEREAFQEIDYRRMFGPMAKWVAQIDDASRLQEYISRAFRVALSGRQGPVVLALPEDMLYDEFVAPPAARFIDAPLMSPDDSSMERLQASLLAARNPMVIVGGGGWNQGGMDALAAWVEQLQLPVAASFRCQSLLDNNHPNYIGHFSVGRTPYLDNAAKDADLIVCVGARLGEITTGGYALFSTPVPEQNLVHVYPSGEELGRVYEPHIGIVSDVNSFCKSAVRWAEQGSTTNDTEGDTTNGMEGSTTSATAGSRAQNIALRSTVIKTLRVEFEKNNSASSVPGDGLAQMFNHMNKVLPENAIVCNGAGNYAAWLHRFYRFRHSESQLAPTSGSMGFGLPAAVAAAVVRPEREVFAIAGDGCFLMNSQELATVIHHGLSLTLVIINNARYGTIRAHQEREYPQRMSGTELTNPDFIQYGKAYGAGTARVNTFDEFKLALANARESGGLQLIEISQDRAILAPGKPL